MLAKDSIIIMVNYYYPPLKSPGVTRNYYLSKSFRKLFKNIIVCTTSNRNILTKEQIDPLGELHVEEIKTIDYRSVWNKKKKNSSIHFDDNKKKFWFVKIAIKLIDTFPFNVLLGEGGMIYTVNGFFKIRKLIKRESSPVIYTSFRPYSDLFIGFLVKQFYPRVIWIADFRDLHVEPIYKNVYTPKLQILWNRFMLRKADLITSVSNGLIEQLKKYNRPTFALINGVIIRPPKPYFEKFTISYTGSLFKNERDPSILFECLSDLLTENIIDPENFQILYAGRDGTAFQQLIDSFNLGSVFVNENMVSRDSALEIQSKSHLNLLLSVNSESHKGVLTGKLFEYLGALNSIVLIMIGNYDEEFEKLFKSCNAGNIFYTKEYKKSNIKTYISELVVQWNENKIAPEKINKKEVELSFSWDNNVTQMLHSIDIH